MGRLYDRVAAALLWIAAFAFATGIFFSITLLLGGLPPTEPVAVGLVTIERYSKLKDYLEAALFFLIVPPLTVWLRRAGEKLLARGELIARVVGVAAIAVGGVMVAHALPASLLWHGDL